MSQDELCKLVIQESVELGLEKLGETTPEVAELRKKVSDESMAVRKSLENINQQAKSQITEFLDDTDSLHGVELTGIYQKGLTDCVMILKKLNVI